MPSGIAGAVHKVKSLIPKHLFETVGVEVLSYTVQKGNLVIRLPLKVS